jgi:phosphinothricin acetyltransferase
MEILIRNLDENDWKPVSEIYKQGIETKNATFEKSVPSWEYWNDNHLPVCRFVAELNKEVIGWAALSAFSKREVYKGVAEVSIYVSIEHSGKGIGKKLMNRLIEESEAKGIWSLQASIFPENKASIHLHKSIGFREIGYLEKISVMEGVWRDTVLLERRSKIAGV